MWLAFHYIPQACVISEGFFANLNEKSHRIIFSLMHTIYNSQL